MENIPLIYRNTTTLTFDEFVRDMMLSVGASEDGVRKMWESPRDDNSNSNRLHKILAHAGEDYYRQQFHPGDHLGILWTEIQRRIERNLEWGNIMSGLESLEDTESKPFLYYVCVNPFSCHQ